MHADERTPVDEEPRVTPPPKASAGESTCRHHADRAASRLCARCADFLCELCAIPVEGTDYCPGCVVKVRADVMRFGSYIPWEDRGRLGVTQAALQTVRAAFTRPQEFFQRMPMEGGVTDPLLFGMLMRGIVVVAYGLIFASFYVILAAATGEPMMLLQAGIQFGSIFMNVIQAAVLLFMMAGLLHLGVLVAGGSRGYEATFRVFSYARAVDVLDLIPIVGPFASMGFRVYLNFLGLQAAHTIGPQPAVLIALLPIFLFVFFTVMIVGMVVVMILLIT